LNFITDMVILGIDPGTATTGWGAIKLLENSGQQTAKNKKSSSQISDSCSLKLVDFGCILTDSQDPMGERLLVLKRSLQKVIKEYSPDCMVIERLFFGANSTSALSVGQARGVVLLVARENKLPVHEYTGLEVKLTVANHGRADKKSIQTAVRRHIGIKKLPNVRDQAGREVYRFRDDAFDAVAAAICHVLKTESGQQKAPKSGL
jgi:crossover junction endodeoxyribonuclease RuvC